MVAMKIRVTFIVVPLVFLAVTLAGGSILMSRLFFLSVLVLLISYLWTLVSIFGFRGHVKTSAEHLQAGQWFEDEVTVVNRSRIPKLFLKVKENSDLPGYSNISAFNLPPGGSQSWQTKVYCQRRGRYRLGSLTATVTDPFGFFSLHRNLGEPQSILIYPATPELPFFWPLSSDEPRFGSNHWPISEVGSDASHIREYTSSDSLNRIHWFSTAHTGKLMVKVFDPNRSKFASKNIWIIPDMHQDYHLGDDDEATEEYCITIAASLIKKYIDNGKQVGLIASGDQPYLFSPEMGNQHYWNMLEALALIKATGKVPVDQLISQENERFGISSAVVVITPSADERMTASLRRLKSRGVRVVAILLDSVSFDGTVSAVNTASSLISSDVQVYVIRRGEELARALDSRVQAPHISLLSM